MDAKRIANMAMLVALAIIFSYVEFMIPINLGIPGIKLGLANLVIVIALYTLKLSDVWIISILRILIIGFMFGSGMSIIYSLAGAIVSLIVMMLVKKINGFSIMGVSTDRSSMPQSWTDCGSNDSRRNYKYFVLCTGSFGCRFNHRCNNRHNFKKSISCHKKIKQIFLPLKIR